MGSAECMLQKKSTKRRIIFSVTLLASVCVCARGNICLRILPPATPLLHVTSQCVTSSELRADQHSEHTHTQKESLTPTERAHNLTTRMHDDAATHALTP